MEYSPSFDQIGRTSTGRVDKYLSADMYRSGFVVVKIAEKGRENHDSSLYQILLRGSNGMNRRVLLYHGHWEPIRQSIHSLLGDLCSRL